MDEKRLQPLLQLAEQKVDVAVRQLQYYRQDSEAQQARLDELQRYLQEYESRGASAAHWQMANHSAFLSRLRLAVAQQQEAVNKATHSLDDAIQRWSQQRQDLQRFEHLGARARQRRQSQNDRVEQRELDEYASRRVGLSL